MTDHGSLQPQGASVPTEQSAWSDSQRKQTVIESVTERDGGYEIGQDGGWICWLGKEHGVTPVAGETLTLWGKGLGYGIRGMAVGERVAFYRSSNEDQIHQRIQTYGADAADWLARWDRGDGVWTITMGGLSAGYDQAINLIAAEMVRAFLKLQLEKGEWQDEYRALIDVECADALFVLGLSGSQYGVALSFAWRLYRDGPLIVVAGAPDDRRIQASKDYPTLDPAILASRALGEQA